MKVFKKIGIVLLSIIVLLVVVAFFLPSKKRIERSIVMNAEPEVIFNQFNTLKNWNNWSAWYKKDTTMKQTYSGPESGIGSKNTWESKDMKGSMEIKESKQNEWVKIQLDFGSMGQPTSDFKLEKADKRTKVTWGMDSDFDWMPWKRWFVLFLEKFVGPDYDAGLANMKEVVEKMPPPSNTPDDAMKIINTTVPQQNLLMVRVKCSEKEISGKIGESYGKIGAYSKKNGANMAGAPLAIYYKWGKDGFEFDAAIPFDKKLPGEGEVKSGEIKAGNVVMVNYYGDYAKIKPAHDMIQEYIKSNNKKTTGAPWEVYANDPGKDTAKWLTQVYYPVE